MAHIQYESIHRIYANATHCTIYPTWQAAILPQLGELGLYKRWEQTGWGYYSNVAVFADLDGSLLTPVPFYNCPTRRAPATYPDGPYSSSSSHTSAKTDYALNAGCNISVPASAGEPTGIRWLRGIWDDAYYVQNLKSVCAKQVTDGLGKTYLVCEKTVQSDRYETGQDVGDFHGFLQCDTRGPYHDEIPCHRFADALPEHDMSSAAEHDNPITNSHFPIELPSGPYIEICRSCQKMGGAHSSAWNVVFCDGSVHSISYNIDLATHQALSTRAAGDSPDQKQY